MVDSTRIDNDFDDMNKKTKIEFKLNKEAFGGLLIRFVACVMFFFLFSISYANPIVFFIVSVTSVIALNHFFECKKIDRKIYNSILKRN